MALTPITGTTPAQMMLDDGVGPAGAALEIQIGNAENAPAGPNVGQGPSNFATKVQEAFTSFKDSVSGFFAKAGEKISSFFKALGERISDARNGVSHGPAASVANLYDGKTHMLDFTDEQRGALSARLTDMARGDASLALEQNLEDVTREGAFQVSTTFAGDSSRATYRINGEALVSAAAFKEQTGEHTVPASYLRDQVVDLLKDKDEDGVARATGFDAAKATAAVTAVAHQGLFAEHINATIFTAGGDLVAFADATGFPASVTYDITSLPEGQFRVEARAEKNVNRLLSAEGEVVLNAEESFVSYEVSVLVDTSGAEPRVTVENATTAVTLSEVA